MREVDFNSNSFGTIIMMGNTFGLSGSFERTRKLLKRLCRMVSKDGLIIATTRDIYKIDNSAHLEYHKFNRERKRMSIGGVII